MEEKGGQKGAYADVIGKAAGIRSQGLGTMICGLPRAASAFYLFAVCSTSR